MNIMILLFFRFYLFRISIFGVCMCVFVYEEWMKLSKN